MWRHYLSVALRGIVRHRLYSAINVVGLAAGLTCIIFVILFVRDELSYDKWIPDTRDLYRVELTALVPARGPLPMAVIPYPLPAVMRDQIPGVIGMTRLFPQFVTLTSGDRQLSRQIDVVDPDFFRDHPAAARQGTSSLGLQPAGISGPDAVGRQSVFWRHRSHRAGSSRLPAVIAALRADVQMFRCGSRESCAICRTTLS